MTPDQHANRMSPKHRTEIERRPISDGGQAGPAIKPGQPLPPELANY